MQTAILRLLYLLYLVALDGDGRELKQAVAVCCRAHRHFPHDVPLADAECLDRLLWHSNAKQPAEDLLHLTTASLLSALSETVSDILL